MLLRWYFYYYYYYFLRTAIRRTAALCVCYSCPIISQVAVTSWQRGCEKTKPHSTPLTATCYRFCSVDITSNRLEWLVQSLDRWRWPSHSCTECSFMHHVYLLALKRNAPSSSSGLSQFNPLYTDTSSGRSDVRIPSVSKYHSLKIVQISCGAYLNSYLDSFPEGEAAAAYLSHYVHVFKARRGTTFTLSHLILPSSVSLKIAVFWVMMPCSLVAGITVLQERASVIRLNVHPARLTTVRWTPSFFNAPCQFTLLLNLCSLVFGLAPFG